MNKIGRYLHINYIYIYIFFNSESLKTTNLIDRNVTVLLLPRCVFLLGKVYNRKNNVQIC